MRPARRAAWLSTVLAGLAVLLTVPAGPAHADLYRYWSFWQEDPSGQWAFVAAGPAATTPANGAVDGWRFSVGGIDATTTRPPRTTPTFMAVCGDEAAPAGQKRVAVVIDTGTPADAPDSATPPPPQLACATVPVAANSLQTLQSVTATRLENGVVCGVSGYPAGGCTGVVAGATAVPTDSPTQFAVAAASAPATSQSSGGSAQLVGAVVAVGALVVLGIVAIVFARRRRS